MNMKYKEMQDKMKANYKGYIGMTCKLTRSTVLGTCYMMAAMPISCILLYENLTSDYPKSEEDEEGV